MHRQILNLKAQQDEERDPRDEGGSFPVLYQL
jgi:hypothetical protein